MKYPFNINSVEKVNIDPTNIQDGVVWYNITEQVYKCWSNNKIDIFLTESMLDSNLDTYVYNAISSHTFKFTFSSVYTINIRHNMDTISFNYTIYDKELNTTLQSSVEIIDSNEIKIDFVDEVTGDIFIYFE
jgi:hypothetical protein